MTHKILIFLTAAFILCLLQTRGFAQTKQNDITDEAQRLYQKHGRAIYQIQVIDLTSDKKTSIGSGFQISQDGLIATNYHVVAEAIQSPKENRIEYLTDEGTRGALEIITADVVHDLAIVKKAPESTDRFIPLGSAKMPKGARIFSMGNPHDIGFTIIEGTYNSISKESLYQKIHFSGSLNPGMSGGPALNRAGQVIGINVSTAGNQISFLVPVEPLQKLANSISKTAKAHSTFLDNVTETIQTQLSDNQHRFVSELLKQKWETEVFGPFKVPGKISTVFRCWGGQNHDDSSLYLHYRSTCSSQDRLYLERDLSTGPIVYRYDYLQGKDELNLTRFYSYYQNLYGKPLGAHDNGGKSTVTNFTCNSDYIPIADKKWKSSFCVRQYKKYPLLFDLHMYLALVDNRKEGFLFSLVAQGISQENALKLSEKFILSIHPAL